MKFYRKEAYKHIITEEQEIKKHFSENIFHPGYNGVKSYFDIRKRKFIVVYSNIEPVYIQDENEFGYPEKVDKLTTTYDYDITVSAKKSYAEDIPIGAKLLGVDEIDEYKAILHLQEERLLEVQETFQPETGMYVTTNVRPAIDQAIEPVRSRQVRKLSK